MINIEKQVEKIELHEDTMLVEVVSDDGADNHMVYMVAEDGSILDFVHVVNTRIADVIHAIPHMMVINFTPMKFWKMLMETMMYNRIFEFPIAKYDDFSYWAMNTTMVELFRHFCKIINVASYTETDEYMNEIHIVNDYIYSKPVPIEHSNPEVHDRAVAGRKRQIEIIKEWAL